MAIGEGRELIDVFLEWFEYMDEWPLTVGLGGIEAWLRFEDFLLLRGVRGDEGIMAKGFSNLGVFRQMSCWGLWWLSSSAVKFLDWKLLL